MSSGLKAFAICTLASIAFGCTRSHDAKPEPARSAVSAQPSASNTTVHAPAPAPAGSAKTAEPAPLPAEASGQQLYERYCRLCHGADATGYAADNAPSLVSRTFLESATDAYIAQGIRVGRPNTPMAAYGDVRGGPLSEPQIAAIVRFLRSKGPAAGVLPERAPSGNPQKGAAIYAQSCQSCHGTPTTRGSALQLLNPELLASASASFLRHAIVHGRPPAPMPAFGEKLSSAQIEDVLAYVVGFTPTVEQKPPTAKPEVPKNLPVVINPKGGKPSFTLRDGRFVSAEQVKRALDAKKRLVIVDARAPSDWLEFHIPGAISLPYYNAAELKRIPNDGTWVVAYCACPHHASGEVVDALRREKYPNTAVLDEGILFWRDRGYPLEGAAVKSTKPAPARP